MSETVTPQRQLYGVGIFEEEIVLSDFTGDVERRFLVTPEQLMDFFRSEVTFYPFPGLVWMKTDGLSHAYLITLPAAERTILYRKQPKKEGKGNVATLRMRLPALAVRVGVDISTRKIQTIDIWGFTGRELKPDSILYELPLPNLSGSRLCLGSTERVEADGDIRGAVERTIFDTPFNHHSYIVGTEKIAFPEYVKKYRGRCPLKTLNCIGHGHQLLGRSA